MFSVSASMTVPTMEELKVASGVSDSQLDTKLQDQDLCTLGGYFDEPKQLLYQLRLLPAQSADIKLDIHNEGTQSAVAEALKKWKNRNPMRATFKELAFIGLNMSRGDIALDICKYAHSQQKVIIVC